MNSEFEIHEHQRQGFAAAFYQLQELTRCIKGGLSIEADDSSQRLYYWQEGTGFGLGFFNGKGLFFNMSVNRRGVGHLGIFEWKGKKDTLNLLKLMHFDRPDQIIGPAEILMGPEDKRLWDKATIKLIDKFTNSFLTGKAKVVVPKSS